MLSLSRSCLSGRLGAADAIRLCALLAQLDRLRDVYSRIDVLLHEMLPDEQRWLASKRLLPSDLLDEVTLVYMPQLGFLTKLPVHPAVSPSGSDLSSRLPAGEFDFKFRTESHVYYKTPATQNLDETHGDVQAHLTDTEQAIVRNVQEKITGMADILTLVGNKVAELDWSVKALAMPCSSSAISACSSRLSLLACVCAFQLPVPCNRRRNAQPRLSFFDERFRPAHPRRPPPAAGETH